MQIINYTVSALVLLFVVLLFLRAALPHTEAPSADIKELTPEELEFKVAVLAMNSASVSPRGGGIGIRGAARRLRRFYARMLREAYGRTEDFERVLLKAREDTERAVREVESESERFFVLPHKGGIPRVYALCSLLISGSGGYAGFEEIKKAVRITNEYSPLSIEEIKVMESMLKACYIERLAALAVRSQTERKLKLRAEKDVAEGRVNLSMLKFDAYINAYSTAAESDSLRKFSALCFENGVDVALTCRRFEREKARRAAVAFASLLGIRRTTEMFVAETLLDFYGSYKQFAEKCDGFSRLSSERKLAHIDAFARLCRRKNENEHMAAKTATGSKLASALTSGIPSVYALGGAIFGAFILGALPFIAVSVVKGGLWIPVMFLSLPVTLAAVFRLLRRFSISKAEQAGWISGDKNAVQTEISADLAAQEARFHNIAERRGARAETYLSVVSDISRIFESVAPVFAVALVLVAPLMSAYLLFAVFSREIIYFGIGMRKAVSGKSSAAKGGADALVFAASLPKAAAESIFRLFRKKLPKSVGIVASAVVSASLTVLTAVFGGSFVFYIVAAAFALAPLAEENIFKFKRKEKSKVPLAEEENIRKYDDYGVLPAVAFLRCGDYLAMSSERGGGRDVYCGNLLFKEMKLYAKSGDGKYEPFTFVPPFLSLGGRTVNNALCAGNTFSVETSGFDGGKRITVTSHGGGDFEIICVHLSAGRLDRSEKEIIILKREEALPLYISAATDEKCAVSVERRERFGRESDILSVKGESREGKISFYFCCDTDKTALSDKTACLLREGFSDRGEAFVATLSKPSYFTPAVCDIASYALYGKCSYDEELSRYVDIRYPSVVCVLRGENGIGRLRRRLKRLSIVRSLGIPFNSIVVCFDGSEHFFRLKDRISVIFSESGLDTGGRAVCLDCADNRLLYEKIAAACLKDEDIRRTTRLPCPEIRSFKRCALPIEFPDLMAEGTYGGVSKEGEGIYLPFGAGAAAENTIAYDGFGFTAKADGSSCTFDGVCALTGEPNALCGFPAESVTLGENGRVWGFDSEGASFCAHGNDGSRYVCSDGGLYSELSVRLVGGAKIYAVSVKSPRKSARKVRVMLAVRPVLGESFEDTRHVVELDECAGGAWARNRITGKKLFVETDAENFERALTEEAVTDENGIVCRVENLSGIGASPAIVISAELKVRPQSCTKVNFALSKEGGFDFGLLGTSKDKRHALFVCGDNKLDVFAENLRAQVNTSLEYVPPTGERYAEKLVLCAALLPHEREKMRSLIFSACESRFENGDVLSVRKNDKGERSVRSGASLFLPMAVARYIDCTDDRDILFERRRYLESSDRRSCRQSKKAVSVLEHCLETLFMADDGALTPCFGIEGRLLALRAVSAFMPLVRDGETRLKLAEIKSRISDEVEKLDACELSAVDLSWLSLVGAGKPSLSAFLRKAENASDVDLVWLSAALLQRGDIEEAYLLFSRINPIETRGDTPFISCGENVSKDLGIVPAIAYMLLAEGFYGCRTRGETVVFSPALPKKFKRACINYREDNIDFKVDIEGVGSGKWRLYVDGISYNSNSLKKTTSLTGKRLVLRRG